MFRRGPMRMHLFVLTHGFPGTPGIGVAATSSRRSPLTFADGLDPGRQRLQALPKGHHRNLQLSDDAGHRSAAQVDACEQADIELLIALGRAWHQPPATRPLADPLRCLRIRRPDNR